MDYEIQEEEDIQELIIPDNPPPLAKNDVSGLKTPSGRVFISFRHDYSIQYYKDADNILPHTPDSPAAIILLLLMIPSLTASHIDAPSIYYLNNIFYLLVVGFNFTRVYHVDKYVMLLVSLGSNFIPIPPLRMIIHLFYMHGLTFNPNRYVGSINWIKKLPVNMDILRIMDKAALAKIDFSDPDSDFQEANCGLYLPNNYFELMNDEYAQAHAAYESSFAMIDPLNCSWAIPSSTLMYVLHSADIPQPGFSISLSSFFRACKRCFPDQNIRTYRSREEIISALQPYEEEYERLTEVDAAEEELTQKKEDDYSTDESCSDSDTLNLEEKEFAHIENTILEMKAIIKDFRARHQHAEIPPGGRAKIFVDRIMHSIGALQDLVEEAKPGSEEEIEIRTTMLKEDFSEASKELACRKHLLKATSSKAAARAVAFSQSASNLKRHIENNRSFGRKRRDPQPSPTRSLKSGSDSDHFGKNEMKSQPSPTRSLKSSSDSDHFGKGQTKQSLEKHVAEALKRSKAAKNKVRRSRLKCIIRSALGQGAAFKTKPY